MTVLAANAGSGTTVLAVFEAHGERALTRVATATLTHHEDPPLLSVDEEDATPVPDAPTDRLLSALDLRDVTAVGHRIVHGGRRRSHAVVDDDVLDDLRDAARFAPLHNPRALELLDAARGHLPDATHVACLDTAFHETMPPAATVYGGPRSWWDEGLRRRGFHGLSHQDAATRAAAALGRPIRDLCLVTVHCGGGVSATAVARGHSADTTMGLTPAEGPIMATRSGSVDPGLLLHLMRSTGADADRLEALLEQESGLLGLSGTSGHEPELRRRRCEDPRAELAVTAYEHRLAAAVGSVVPALPRLDALVLTGSVLEEDADLRAGLASALGALGVGVDLDVNAGWSPSAGAAVVASATAAVPVVVVPAHEEAAIARHTLALAG